MDESNHRARSFGDLLRHPLANVVIGFLLTGVLGTTLTQYFVAQREKQAKQHELTTTRKESIAKLSALNAEYLARAEMFLAAVDRGDAGNAKELKAMFDDASVRWRTETSPILMAARDVLPPEIYVRFRDRLSEEFREDPSSLRPVSRTWAESARRRRRCGVTACRLPGARALGPSWRLQPVTARHALRAVRIHRSWASRAC